MANDKSILDFTDNLLELERRIEMGYIPENVAFSINKFSRFVLANNTLSLAASFNNLNPFLDVPAELFVSSSSGTDTGATKTVVIKYINQARAMQEVSVELTGQTAVSLGTDIYCVWRMENQGAVDYVGIISVGSEAIPVAGVPVATNTYCNIPLSAGGILPVNKSLTSVYSIPDGWTGFFTVAEVSADKGGDIDAASTLRPFGGVFQYGQTLSVFQNTKIVSLFQRLPSKSDLKILAIAQTGANSAVRYRIILIKNEYVDRFINQVG